MYNDIVQVIERCRACQKHLPSLPQADLIEDTAKFPMEKVELDLFEWKGQNWLIMIDRFSGWPFAQRLNKTTTDKITSTLDGWFLTWGFPERIKSDNGPQFRDQFQQYCSSRDIVFVTSSPYHPASNGCAEAGVKNIKKLLDKCEDTDSNFELALLEFRNTPRSLQDKSPAQLFLGRSLKSIFPTLHIKNECESKDECENKENNNESKFQPGDNVLIQNPTSNKWDQQGEIVESCGFADRSYIVQTPQGQFRRNIRFLRPDKTVKMNESEHNADKNVEMHSALSPRRSDRIAQQKKKVSFDLDRIAAKKKKVSFNLKLDYIP